MPQIVDQIVPGDLTQFLLDWAKHYTSCPQNLQRIIERTALLAADNPDELLQPPLDRSLKALMHRVAKEELLREGEPKEIQFFRHLKTKKVLVVEDEFIQADELATTLAARGAEIVGPYPEVETAMLAISDRQVDVAVLDIRLSGEDSFPLADELTRRRIPFMFLSGYDRSVLPARFKLARHYLKPLDAADIPSVVSLCLSDHRTC